MWTRFSHRFHYNRAGLQHHHVRSNRNIIDLCHHHHRSNAPLVAGVKCHLSLLFYVQDRPTPARESSYEKRRENPAFVSPALQPRRVNTHKVSVVRREVYEKLVPFDVRRPELRAKNDVVPHSSTPRGHVISSRVRCYNTCSIFFSGQ